MENPLKPKTFIRRVSFLSTDGGAALLAASSFVIIRLMITSEAFLRSDLHACLCIKYISQITHTLKKKCLLAFRNFQKWF